MEDTRAEEVYLKAQDASYERKGVLRVQNSQPLRGHFGGEIDLPFQQVTSPFLSSTEVQDFRFLLWGSSMQTHLLELTRVVLPSRPPHPLSQKKA